MYINDKKCISLDYATYTFTGSRAENEDFYYANNVQEKALFMVADGLGGHGYGRMASMEAISQVSHYINDHDISEETMINAFQEAHQSLQQKQDEISNHHAMKTTMVALAMDEKNTMWANAGDSRLYLFEGRSMKGRTLDHSVPQMLLEAHTIKEKEIRFHPDRNIILKALGDSSKTINPDVYRWVSHRKNLAFLLCTDGFWELVNEKQMKQCLLKSQTAGEWLKRMSEIVESCSLAVKKDNATAVAVFVNRKKPWRLFAGR